MDTIHTGWPRERSRHLAGGLLRLRHERIRHLLPLASGGVAWHLMVALAAEDSGRDPSVADLAERAAVPRTTTFRWLRELTKQGLVTMSRDDEDKRVVRVQLTPSGEHTMDSIFAAARLQSA